MQRRHHPGCPGSETGTGSAYIYEEFSARLITTAHEYTGWQNGGTATDSVMDLRNNAIGISIGLSVKSEVDAGSIPMEEYLNAIAQRLLALKEQGRFWVFESFNKTYLEFNDKRNLGVTW